MSKGDVAIRADGVCKLFRIGSKELAHDSLAGAVLDLIKSPAKNYRKYRSLYYFNDVISENGIDAAKVQPLDVIWALRDVSFEIKQGEVIGFIGRNGAGKSTLLKVLTRITPPTHGRIQVTGRVSSLLEVGTGFHQELTGRENIYLNGTILGMKKKEVDRKFDEIVEFSGVERFIDTPVKRYSSGMSVRLAFAVAAHLEPEILIIDEVLAVGDSAFQKKCLNKMQDVGKHGSTVLFVSHNMAAVNRLCSRAILLDSGKVTMTGSPHDVIGAYLDAETGLTASREWPELARAPGGEVARLRAVRAISRKGEVVDHVDVRRDVGLQMVYDVLQPGFVLLPHFYVHDQEGVLIFGTLDQDPAWRGQPRPEGTYTSTAWIPGNLLSDGKIFVSCAVITRNPDDTQFFEQQTIAFHVTDSMGEGTARGDWAGDFNGVIRPLLKWDTEVQSNDVVRLSERYSG